MSSVSITTDELSDSIRKLLQAEGDLSLARLEPPQRSQIFQDLWDKLAGLGCLGLAIHEQYGGLGLGFRELGILYEELGRHLNPLPVLTTLLFAEAIARGGNDEQRARWLPAIAAGTLRATLTLPNGQFTLPRLDEDHSVHGNLLDVLYADSVDELLLPVQCRRGELYLAIIPVASEQVEIVSRPIFDLTRTLCELRLKGVAVGQERLMPLDERVWSTLLDHASVALGCDAVGGASRILEDTVSYLGSRRQFDRPIGSFQALKHRAATWKIMLEGARALSRHAADLLADQDCGRSAVASGAKVSACEAYVAIAGDSVQLHGGIGFTWEHECHLFLKRAKLNAALFGSLSQHKDRAAEYAFTDPTEQPNRARRLLLHPGNQAFLAHGK